ncbi:pilus assembly protein PilZ [Pseudomonas sp. PA15(2017)]|uniref:PilZ domain-containing protein n=1 Tax=Pseudomonas sp. PA15(2017) TaxID=1932111 RepID=UPI00095E8546|nr:PilZ domain-containing protein [Pseudomonas sp. PA15(2017)]OLU29525.1 pilus assembly protein PilZ [Pseudomonas sp. PA15(2017)]
MEDRRQHPRYQSTSRLEVHDQQSESYLGRIADLSSEGFMLCSMAPQSADTLVECKLVGEDMDEVRFTADCLWSREGAIGQPSWAGYHIIDIDALNMQKLQTILEHLQGEG